ncbi:sperm-associated antigen 1-like [Mercenaria mercenaria]|uniref:sperm-associated antigen 1-like n=1 Tax=Mercenaria mercenaria TaxID=6596 RepID=UPI00234E8F2C|nr:sperm-associated antigen 1-like [Mercenaria mercenaria]
MSFRRLPGDFDMDKLPEKWYCKNNPDPLFNRCEIPEELEGEDEEKVQPKPTYTKTVQKKKAEKKRQEKLEEERKAREKEEALNAAKETAAEEAKQKEEALKTAREKEEALKAVAEEAKRKEEALKAAKEEALKKEETLKKQVEKQRKALEKQKKALDYINPDLATEERAKGNALFKQGKYSEALKHYEEAVKRNPKDAKLHSNRAACYSKLQEFNRALAACDDCLHIDPNFIKGYLHRGNVLLNYMNDNTEAVRAYEKALQLDPNCAEAIKGLQASQGDESSEGLATSWFEPLNNSLDNTEVSPGKRKYPDRDGSDDRITRQRTSENGNHPVTTMSFGGLNFERSPAKRNSPKKTFPKPRTGTKSSPRTVSKRSVESTSGTNSARSSSSTPLAIHTTLSASSSNEINSGLNVTGNCSDSFSNGNTPLQSRSYTISSTGYAESDQSPFCNGTPGLSNNVPTVCVEVSSPAQTGTKSATCKTALNFDNANSNLNNANPATNSVDDSMTSGQVGNVPNEELAGIDNGYTEMEADPDKKPEEGELERMLTEMDQVLNGTLPNETDEKKVFQHKASQTVPTVVKFASPNEVELLKLCPTEQRQQLLVKTRELDELRRSILTLMKILQPDYEYGPPENVDKVIKEFIKANNEQNNSS